MGRERTTFLRGLEGSFLIECFVLVRTCVKTLGQDEIPTASSKAAFPKDFHYDGVVVGDPYNEGKRVPF